MNTTTQPPAAGQAAHIVDELIGVTKRLRDAVSDIKSPPPRLRAHIQGVATGGAYLAILDDAGSVIARSPFQRDDDDIEEMSAQYRFIETACNSHARLTADNKALREALKDVLSLAVGVFPEGERTSCVERTISNAFTVLAGTNTETH